MYKASVGVLILVFLWSVMVSPKENDSFSSYQNHHLSTVRPYLFGKCTSINEAGSTALTDLPYIGPKIAFKILSFRQINGSFTSNHEIVKVKGIGDKTAKKIHSLLCNM